MALDADTLLDRMQLKQQITKWRTLAIAIAVIAGALYVSDFSNIHSLSSGYIARVTVEDVITDDAKRDALLENLVNDGAAKAVFVRLDTPGGTAVGGEELYRALRRISEVKPVVILMRTLCTSAGYMAALGGNYILAREGTVTGSIGVIMQSFEATKLANMIGVTPITIKSGANKAAPNPLEKFSPEQHNVLKNVVDRFHQFFVSLVLKHRPIDKADIGTIADGRVFTGKQALEAKLIDGLGGEEEAKAWLAKEHEIDPGLKVRDIKPERDVATILGQFQQMVDKTLFSIKKPLVTLDGLLLIWQPAPR